MSTHVNKIIFLNVSQARHTLREPGARTRARALLPRIRQFKAAPRKLERGHACRSFGRFHRRSRSPRNRFLAHEAITSSFYATSTTLTKRKLPTPNSSACSCTPAVKSIRVVGLDQYTKPFNHRYGIGELPIEPGHDKAYLSQFVRTYH